MNKATENGQTNNINYWISYLNLEPHPEGGFFSEIYRSKNYIPEKLTKGKFNGQRSYMTSIYFLLSYENFSAFHRLKQDELWSFHTGSSINVHIIDEDGNYSKNKVGLKLHEGETPQFLIEAGQWFSYNVEEPGGFTVVGCAVAPGFEFADFELGYRDHLIKKYPHLKEIITKYTRQ